MRKVKRWRYYCEFCKKSGGSGGHMQKHENGCTLNPKRHCGMCDISGGFQEPIESLVAIVEKHIYMAVDVCKHSGIESITVLGDRKGMLAELGDKTENCPACMMAAIRQAGVPVPATGFDYKDHYKEFWLCYNDSQAENIGSYGYY